MFRAPNNSAGKCWMDALELALRCSSLLLRTMGKPGAASSIQESSSGTPAGASGGARPGSLESDPDMSELDGDHSGCERDTVGK